MARVIPFIGLAALYPSLCGFVLLSSEKATLPVSLADPVLTFVWDGDAPKIKEKQKFMDGRYDGLEDRDFMRALLVESLALWNQVPGSFVTLAVIEEPTEGAARLDNEDRQFSIVTEKSNNLSTAAFAKPEMPDETPGTIVDCDISISDVSVEARELAFTIAHEIGHCLGLGHSHTNYNAMMGYSRSARDFRLGADDVAGITYLYPDPAYGATDPKELVCGAVQGPDSSNATGMMGTLMLLVAMLLLPVAAVAPAAIRRKWGTPYLLKINR